MGECVYELYKNILVDRITIDEEIITAIKNCKSYHFVDVDNRPHKTMKIPIETQDGDCEQSKKIRIFIENMLKPYADKYRNKYSIKELDIRPNIIVSLLEENKWMESHRDCEDEMANNFLIMCYLTGNCEGGELCFDELGMTINPSEGMVVVYKSYYLHSVQKLIRGARYSLTVGYYEE